MENGQPGQEWSLFLRDVAMMERRDLANRVATTRLVARLLRHQARLARETAQRLREARPSRLNLGTRATSSGAARR